MAKTKTTEDSISFEEALDKLEQVVRHLEDGQLGLSESLAQYEEGVRHLKHCHQALAAAERKIELLTSVNEEGNARTEPFDDELSAPVEQKKRTPSSRRSTRTTSRVDDDAANDVDTQRGLF
ncbi:MAG: exodeoxyribonuclease VII small subunit [Planctomycetota bacterium]|nr:exodeoxyribonuclease VII small subunit [Planctomycetota bacterium]